ncbi:MAG: hypothetical protein J2P38_10520, partial [Candidatus Dormibacteraeota bacterium]|nr:hypothetical protein [Candidatus Dormibacteraeota bacterium]
AAGGLSGLLAVAVLVVDTLVARDPAQLAPSSMVILLLWIIGPIAAGVAAGLLTRQGHRGLLAGFWCGVVFALVVTIGLLGRDVAFAGTLDHTAWVGDHFADHLCDGARGSTLAGCEVGDDFGFAASLLLVGPLLAGLIGLVGSALATVGRRSGGPLSWRWSRSTTALVAFSAVLLALFVVEVATNLW